MKLHQAVLQGAHRDTNRLRAVTVLEGLAWVAAYYYYGSTNLNTPLLEVCHWQCQCQECQCLRVAV